MKQGDLVVLKPVIKGDIVLWHSKSPWGKRKEYGLVMDVSDKAPWGETEVLVRFPSDGFEGWFRAETLDRIDDSSK